MTHKLYFQDLEIGQTFELGRTKLSKTDIIEFATQFNLLMTMTATTVVGLS